jgi:hypothetical protein
MDKTIKITFAGKKPRSSLRTPTTLLKEKTSPLSITHPLIKLTASAILFFLSSEE